MADTVHTNPILSYNFIIIEILGCCRQTSFGSFTCISISQTNTWFISCESKYTRFTWWRSVDIHFNQCLLLIIEGFFCCFCRDDIAKKVKARDQYGSVLSLPKGMKPHMKTTMETDETATESTSMWNFIFGVIFFLLFFAF